MADESEAVVLQRIRWEGYKALAQTVANVLLAVVVAVQTYYQAQTATKVEHVRQQSEANGKKVDDLRAEGRMMFHAPDAKAKE